VTPAPAETPPGQDRRGRFRALDGLRGLAVLLVLMDHASDVELRIFPGADMNRAGKYGVYLFFVLSAFLLTHLFFVKPAAELTSARTWMNYLVRRFLRIFPLYTIVLIVLVHLSQLKPAQIATHLFLRDGVKQFWTIPVEVKYYMILPFVVVAAGWFARKDWLRGSLMTIFAAGFTMALFRFEAAWSLHEAVLLCRNLEPFILGSAAALAHEFMVRRAAGAARFAMVFEVLAIAALTISIIRIPSIYNAVFDPVNPIRKFGLDSAVCGVLWTVVLLGLLHGNGLLRGVMEWLPLRYLGLISYSAYLWHQKFLRDVDDMPLPLPLRLVVFLVVVIAVSSVSYFLIERPLSRIRFEKGRLVAARPTLSW
jgi:peptidoglycan/LPS O-acetylase OafA/YrhL